MLTKMPLLDSVKLMITPAHTQKLKISKLLYRLEAFTKRYISDNENSLVVPFPQNMVLIKPVPILCLWI